MRTNSNRTSSANPIPLIILQYGGNAVPYLKDEAHAKRFARSAARQINHIKSLYPNAAIIYVGPSDMARKNGLKMEAIRSFRPLSRPCVKRCWRGEPCTGTSMMLWAGKAPWFDG